MRCIVPGLHAKDIGIMRDSQARVVEFERACLLKAKLRSCMRRFSILLAQRRSEIPTLQEDS
jgi:hypothetical protein